MSDAVRVPTYEQKVLFLLTKENCGYGEAARQPEDHSRRANQFQFQLAIFDGAERTHRKGALAVY